MAESSPIQTDEVYEAYIRDADGGTRYMPFRQAMEHFLGEDGYRVSINVEGVRLTLRKDTRMGEYTQYLDEHIPGRRSTEALVTIDGMG